MSVASEITRLQTAKADLKTAINAKTDAQHQITNETIDEYADFVDSISSGGGTSTLYVRDFPGMRFGKSTFTSIPSNIDFTGVTNFSNMFYESSLSTVSQGDINASSGTNFDNMFASSDISSVAGLDTSSGTIFSFMFSGCYELTTAPNIDTSKGVDMSDMVAICSNLTTVPEYDFSSATNIYGLLEQSTEIVNLGGFKDLGKAYLTSRSANYGQYTLDLNGPSYNPNTNISYASLMNVINKLYDIKTKGCRAQKLVLGSTLMGKLTAEEIAIATNKGWTVS